MQDQKLVTKIVYPILFSICFAHLLNDLIQAIIPSIYPILKQKYQLSFTQIGLITFAFQFSASIFQPFVGYYTDKYPRPFSQVIGMFFTLSGVVSISFAYSFEWIVFSVILIGTGSAIFHPESARISSMASGGKRGLAQSIFQIGGNFGTALAPLLVAVIVVPNGQKYILWFVFAATIAIGILTKVAYWYRDNMFLKNSENIGLTGLHDLSKPKIRGTIILLLIIIFSKFFYSACLSTYYQFYIIEKFKLSIQQAQYHLFIYMIAYTIGTLLGGSLGDKFGRKYIIFFSVFGATPFALMLPYANLFYTDILMIIIGIIISSAFPAIIVYAQELLPKNLGLVSGLFYGFAFGMGALGSAYLGNLADRKSIIYVYEVCSYLPIIGIVCLFLPNLRKKKLVNQ